MIIISQLLNLFLAVYDSLMLNVNPCDMILYDAKGFVYNTYYIYNNCK